MWRRVKRCNNTYKHWSPRSLVCNVVVSPLGGSVLSPITEERYFCIVERGTYLKCVGGKTGGREEGTHAEKRRGERKSESREGRKLCWLSIAFRFVMVTTRHHCLAAHPFPSVPAPCLSPRREVRHAQYHLGMSAPPLHPFALPAPATETRVVTRASFVFIFESCQLLQTRMKVSFVLPCHLQPTFSPAVLRDAARSNLPSSPLSGWRTLHLLPSLNGH